MTEPALWLSSSGLLSKWGFDDGGMPDEFADWCDEHAVDYVTADWTAVLRTLVREYLLPRLDQQVTVVDISTNHNPVRASTVDGTDVEACWFGRQPAPTLTPPGVAVPYRIVAEVMSRRGAPDQA